MTPATVDWNTEPTTGGTAPVCIVERNGGDASVSHRHRECETVREVLQAPGDTRISGDNRRQRHGVALFRRSPQDPA